MKTARLIMLTAVLLLSCSQIPNDSNSVKSVKDVSLDGTWRSTYYRTAQDVVDGGSTLVEQISTLTIEGNQYRFVFDPAMPQAILHFNLIEQISGIYSLSGDTIFFYDSTGQNLRQELIFSITHDTLTITYPILFDTLGNGSIVRSYIPLGGLPWGYAMNVWKPFVMVN